MTVVFLTATYTRQATCVFLHGLVLVCMCITPDVWGNPLVQHQLAKAGLPAFDWGEDQTVHVSDVPVFIKPFSTVQTVSATGQILADHAGLFQLVLTAPGGLILSGVKAGWHWLAEIESTPAGSKGRVSVLPISPVAAPARNMASLEMNDLLPGAPTSSNQLVTAGGRNITQQTYMVAMPRHELLAYVRTKLTAQGWHSAPDFPGLQGHDAWRRKSSVLSLFAHSVGNETLLYVHFVK